ncbi:MAG: MBL fold metallo-hydrolase [Verrucomicrobia bacterium]|nr:MAG: MBL fold metallo-hydrolase [Verrucomicrobiota bacterium]
MIRPALQDDAFLADVAGVRAGGAGPGPHLWWLGQSGFLLHADGRCLLLDPYLSDSLTRKYAATDKPHVRMTERVVDPARLDFIDVVTSSHAHTDHLDPDTLGPLAAANPGLVLVCPESIRETARQRSGLPPERIVGLDAGMASDGERIREVAGFGFTAVPAAHERLDRDAAGHLVCLGFVVRAGRRVIYHSGDTVRYEGMEERLAREGVDIALLPINGRAPERRVAGNLWGVEAADLATAIGARAVVPCHYDLFEFNTATPEAFASRCQSLGQGYRILRAGERWDVGPSGWDAPRGASTPCRAGESG